MVQAQSSEVDLLPKSDAAGITFLEVSVHTPRKFWKFEVAVLCV